jgi:uncharacterized membrane protein
MDKAISIFLGFILIYLGIEILFDPRVYNPVYTYNFDFTGYNIPLGIFMIVVGIAFIWTTVKGKYRKTK